MLKGKLVIMKICVYAICKNELQFVDAWVKSMSEADYICVLDTGSADGTYEKSQSYRNVIVEQKVISPWRFDVARNESMKLIPEDADMCVCVDLDERFVAGWRKILEARLDGTIDQVYYKYVWNFNPDGSEGVTFFANKMHRRKGFRWKHPVHEIITADKSDIRCITIPELQLNHYADPTKSRSQYLPLLELAAQEDPDSDRTVHYLGREYYFYRKYDEAIKTLLKHIDMPSATWVDERCASLRYIARCYLAKHDKDNAIEYGKRAIAECPNSREPYYDLAVIYYVNNMWLDAIVTLLAMLNITDRKLNYISNPECWGALPYDYLSMCYYYMHDYAKAIAYVDKAIAVTPNDDRLINNRQELLRLYNKASAK